MRKIKLGAGSVVVSWPVIQYFLDWYREPGPMLEWRVVNKLVAGGWVWLVLIFGLWLVYDTLKKLVKNAESDRS